MEILARYGAPDPKRSVFELFITAVPYFLLCALMLYCLERFGYWACLPLALPAAGFLVRLFLIQHDCGHGSFFRRRSTNDRIGRIIGVLTLIPYDYWRRTHAVHHATAGNLDRRGIGDVWLLTVAEYRALPRWQRIAYRLSRNQLVLLGLGPLYLFVKYRLPVGLMRGGKGVWISAMGTNLAIAGVVVGMGALVGIGNFLLVQLPVILLAGSAGVWLFYVQHQFDDTYWARQGGWSFHASALHGATHYDLPGVLRWFTANIGIHHVHHLASRIPSYRLREALAPGARAPAGRDPPVRARSPRGPGQTLSRRPEPPESRNESLRPRTGHSPCGGFRGSHRRRDRDPDRNPATPEIQGRTKQHTAKVIVADRQK